MRLAALVISVLLSGLVLSRTAAAQDWREYVYPDYGFAIHFPADPKIETGVYKLPDGSDVPARIYSLAQDEGVYTVTIADFAQSPLGEKAVMDQAVEVLKRDAEVKIDLPARVQSVYGRQLSLSGQDGSHSSVALFFYQHRLYEINGTVVGAAANAGSSDAIRFQQSLRFTNTASGFFGLGNLFERAVRGI